MNAIILSPPFPARLDVLVVLNQALLIARVGGKSWSDWKADLSTEQGMISVAAPRGLDPEAQLLVGFTEDGVLRI